MSKAWTFTKQNLDVVLLILFPFLLTALTRAWTFHAPVGNVDTYVYTGFFLNLDKYLHVFPNTYYGSRFPWLLIGNAAYWLFSDANANLFLRFLLFYTGTVSVYVTIRLAWRDRFTALVAALLLGVSVYFHASITWDYVDGPGLVGMLLVMALLTASAMTRWSREFLFLAGIAFTTMMSTQIALVILLPSALVWYVALQYRMRRFSLVESAFFFALGAVLAFGFYALIYHHLTGTYNYLTPQIDFAKRDAENPYISPISTWIEGAGWLIVPITSWIASGAILLYGVARALAGRSLKRIENGLLFLCAMSLSNLGFASVFVYEQVSGKAALLQLYFYANYLIPMAVLTIGAAIAVGLSKAEPLWRNTVLAVGAGLIVSPYVTGALGTLLLPLDNCQACSVPGDGGLLALAIAGALVVAVVVKKAPIALVTLAVLAAVNPGTGTDFAGSYFGDTAQKYDRFLLVYDAEAVINRYDPDGQIRIWMDGTEPLGWVYNGTAGLHLWGYRVVSFKFPSFNKEVPGVFIPGRRVAVLTIKPDAVKLANAELASIGLKAELIDQKTVRRGNDAFDVYILSVVPSGTIEDRQLDLATTRQIPGATVRQSSDGTSVTTQPEIWSYSALLAIPEDLRAQYPTSRAFIRVTGTAVKGTTGVGVLQADRGGWIANAPIDASFKKEFELYIPIEKLGNTSDFVVFNWDRPGASTVVLHKVTLYVSGGT